MDFWKHNKREGNSVLLFFFFFLLLGTQGWQQEECRESLEFTRFYLLLRCQTVRCKIVLSDLHWLTRVQRTKMDSPISSKNVSMIALG